MLGDSMQMRIKMPPRSLAGQKGSEGNWWDLCAGPHVDTTGQINAAAISVDSVAGAYWRGDETKAQLQRIYATAWETKDQLKAWKQLQIEAARRCDCVCNTSWHASGSLELQR